MFCLDWRLLPLNSEHFFNSQGNVYHVSNLPENHRKLWHKSNKLAMTRQTNTFDSVNVLTTPNLENRQPHHLLLSETAFLWGIKSWSPADKPWWRSFREWPQKAKAAPGFFEPALFWALPPPHTSVSGVCSLRFWVNDPNNRTRVSLPTPNLKGCRVMIKKPSGFFWLLRSFKLVKCGGC